MHIRRSAASVLGVSVLSLTAIPVPTAATAADRVSAWNSTAVTATVLSGHNAFVQSRTLAVVQIAVHDALNAVERRYEPYAFRGTAEGATSVEAAIAAAARDSLVGAIPVGTLPFVGFGSAAQQANAVAFVNATYVADLAAIPDGAAKDRGIAIGQAAAQAILERRASDGATTLVLYTPGTGPGQWQPTPNPVPFDPPA